MTDRRGFILGATTVALSSAASATGAVAATSAGSPLRIAHLCDPQFGFITGRPGMTHRTKEHYEKNYKVDLARCEKAIALINDLNPDLLLLGGDMTQDAKDIEREWPRLLEKIRVPWMITPGNHDMGNYVTRENLDRFRKVFGRECQSRDIKGWRIITGNSQFWHPTQLKGEQVTYETWVRDELDACKAYRGRVILATHIPVFAFTPDENDSYENCPTSLRTKRLEVYLAAGARFMLTAHQHRLVVRGYKDMTILTGEAMCANMDSRPQGFRLFEVNDDFSYSYNFVTVKER